METRKRYTREFKREVLAQCETPDVSMQQVARELGINPRLLSSWRKDSRVTKERDSLREAAAFFAKPSK